MFIGNGYRNGNRGIKTIKILTESSSFEQRLLSLSLFWEILSTRVSTHAAPPQFSFIPHFFSLSFHSMLLITYLCSLLMFDSCFLSLRDATKENTSSEANSLNLTVIYINFYSNRLVNKRKKKKRKNKTTTFSPNSFVCLCVQLM